MLSTAPKAVDAVVSQAGGEVSTKYVSNEIQEVISDSNKDCEESTRVMS